MKTPIELMLDDVEWKASERSAPVDSDSGLPYATHEGVLELCGKSVRCYRLNTGQAVFNADDLDFLEFFGV
jgi:hypothetical protein